MADEKITAFNSATLPLAGTEIVPLAEPGFNYKTTTQDIANLGKQVSAASVVLGRGSAAGAGAQQELTLGTGLQIAGTVLSVPAGTYGNAQTANPLSQFAATTSAQLAGVLTDETGSGSAVFASAPTLVNPIVGTQTTGDNTTKAASTAFVAAALAATSGSGVPVNAQTGTTYTFLAGDKGKLVTQTNASASAYSLPVASTTGFGANWFVYVQNRGAGTLTITPTTSTIDGATAIGLTTNQGCLLASDGTNYFSMRGIGGSGGGASGTVTSFAFTNGAGFTGTVSSATTTPTLSLTYSAAFQSLTTTGTGASTLSTGVLNVPTPVVQSLTTTGTGAATLTSGVLNIPTPSGGGGSGTVTSFSFTNGGGFTGTVSNATTTPALSLTYSAAFQSLTTTGTGAATLTSGVLNIPTPSGGGGSGTVTSVAATGSRVTGTVTNPTTTPSIALALANTTVTAGSYTNANITVQADGTLTAASNGSGGGGGLADFTDSLNSSTPNATIPVATLSATNAATSVDIAMVPKGSGAFVLAVSNSSTHNKRGTNAVDLQIAAGSLGPTTVAAGVTSFCANANNGASGLSSVAMGDSSFATKQYSIAIGNQAFASGDSSVAIGGAANSAVGDQSVAAGGTNNSASLQYSAVIGGSGGLAQGQGAGVFCGSGGSANSDNSVVLGGYNNSALGLSSCAMGTNANGYNVQSNFTQGITGSGGSGSAQFQRVGLSASTTNTTVTVMTADGAAAATNNQLVMPTGATYVFTGKLIARNQSTVACAGWVISGVIKNVAGTVSLVGTPTATSNGSDSTMTTAAVTIGVDSTNKALKISVTGIASTTIRWVCFLESVQCA